MELNAQIIKKGSKMEFAVLPYSEFLKIKEIIEDYEDIISLRSAKAADHKNKGKSIVELLKELDS